MGIILQGLDGVICFIDDILITGATVEEHMETLKKVLERLRQCGVRIRRDKCFFLKTSVEYLGHRIDAEGIHPTDDKIEAITAAPIPRISRAKSF